MGATLRIGPTLSAAASIPVTIVLFPSSAIPIAIAVAAAAMIVMWHLRHGGSARIRRTPRGTLTFELGPRRRSAKQKERR